MTGRCVAGAALVAALLGCSGTPPPPTDGRVFYDSLTYVVTLGTGTPNADPERFGPATAVVVNGRAYLVDAGAGIVRRASAAARRLPGLAIPGLDIAFITHLHSDHTVGLPDLIFSPWVLDRNRPLRLYGPPGISAMAQHLRLAYQEDITKRLDGFEPINDRGHLVEPTEVTAGVVFQDSNVTVTAIPVVHGSWEHAFAYRFDTADRSILISGDAIFNESIIEACDGCDVLVHEVYSSIALNRRAEVWQQYHRSAHTSAVELAELAKRARPGLLVLYHALPWSESPESIVEEIRNAGYTGEIRYAADLDIF